MRGNHSSHSTTSEVEAEHTHSVPLDSSIPNSNIAAPQSFTTRYVSKSFKLFQPTNSRSAKILFSGVASNNERPLGPSGSPRLPNTIHFHSGTNESPPKWSYFGRGSTLDRPGSSGTASKTGSSLCFRQPRQRQGVCQLSFHSTRKRVGGTGQL